MKFTSLLLAIRTPVHDCQFAGIVIGSTSNNNTISSNTIFNCTEYAVGLNPSSNNNTIKWNSFINNYIGGTSQAYDAGLDNSFSYNYWDNHTSPDTMPKDGIVDIPYDMGEVTKISSL